MATPTTAEIAALVENEQDRMVDVRRTLHRHPELSFLETDTTSLIDEHAAAIGLTKGFCPTDTGAVWTLDGGQPGRTVLIRADIDALPIVETAPIDFASEVEGVMHACGHDAHAAQLLGTAAALAARAEDLPGRYVFLFQPAEEALGGAIAMIDGGVLDHLGAEAVVGCHVASIAPVGLIGIKPGIAMSDSRKITIEASGVGGHGALYTGGADPIVAIALVATRLGGVVEGLELDRLSELVELRLENVGDYVVGQEIKADIFEKGERIDAIAVSKGKGFAGGMKRHNFKGQGASHGNHKAHRVPGSIGGCATPGRVFKGTRMAGRMGGNRVTTTNLTIVGVDLERDLVLVKGAVPGSRGGTVVLRNSVKVATAKGGGSK